jgi:hypothetical protein
MQVGLCGFSATPTGLSRVGKDAMMAAQEIAHPNSVAAAEFFANIVRMYRREACAAQESAEHVKPEFHGAVSCAGDIQKC